MQDLEWDYRTFKKLASQKASSLWTDHRNPEKPTFSKGTARPVKDFGINKNRFYAISADEVTKCKNLFKYKSILLQYYTF